MPVARPLLVVAVLAAVLPLVALQAEEEEAAAAPTIEDLAWLAGTWRNEEGFMPFEETWTAPWGGTMAAVSRGLKEGKTSMVELSSIEPHDGTLHLHLRHFEGGLKPWASEKDALVWTLAESKPNRAVFRNESRPFPREIIYERDGDTLQAILAGVQGGRETRMGFDLKRVTAE
jgi:hypothetical protein